MSNLLFITQVRLESQRFPGKALAPLLGQPMLLWHLDRLSLSAGDRIVVATVDTPANHAIADLCKTHGYDCILFPGAANDVLGRYRYVAEEYEADEIVRVTADCPLIEPAVIDGVLAHRLALHADHVGIAPQWGDGFDVECFTWDALEAAHVRATLPSDREHVTPYLWQHPAQFRLSTYPCPFDLSWMRLSVDTPMDLLRIEDILKRALDMGYGMDIGWREIMAICQRWPGIQQSMREKPINQSYIEQISAERGKTVTWGQLTHGAQHDA